MDVQPRIALLGARANIQQINEKYFFISYSHLTGLVFCSSPPVEFAQHHDAETARSSGCLISTISLVLAVIWQFVAKYGQSESSIPAWVRPA
ncbi:hypothetical protein EVAR_26579_1 [Eumeta japonica]|uniref:Uncharacterized protein n=1 Tax=Eumeta variegata TaxID=151549 RepID=A0A4C1W7H9_EUMVA|nr:hypothetical protein EVAR_26579_1 [Eumeta japonica]